jgi:hypothetical protein
MVVFSYSGRELDEKFASGCHGTTTGTASRAAMTPNQTMLVNHASREERVAPGGHHRQIDTQWSERLLISTVVRNRTRNLIRAWYVRPAQHGLRPQHMRSPES